MTVQRTETFVAKDTVLTTITISTPFAVGDVNMYLLERSGFVVLIDTGIDSDAVWQALVQVLNARALTVQSLDAVFLTHHHEDHASLVQRIVKTNQVPVYVHERAIVRLARDTVYLERRIEFFEDLYRRMGCGEYGERREVIVPFRL